MWDTSFFNQTIQHFHTLRCLGSAFSYNLSLCNLSHLFLCVEDLSLSMLGALQLCSPEVIIIESFWQRCTGDVQLCFCGNDIILVDSAEGTSIKMVWSSYQQKTGGKLLQENNTLKTTKSPLDNAEHNQVIYNSL